MIGELEYILPFLRGVEEKALYKVNQAVSPGGKIEFRPHELGWLVDFTLSVDQKYTNIEHNYWRQKFFYNIYQLYSIAGQIQTQSMFQWVAKYDTVNNLYSTFYAPRPYKFYRKDAYITITAPSIDPLTLLPIVTDTTIYGLIVHYIEITDVTEFKKSIRELAWSIGLVKE